jgi:hypothetical protein
METKFTDKLSPRVEYTSTPQPTPEEIDEELKRWQGQEWEYTDNPEAAMLNMRQHLYDWLMARARDGGAA